MALRKGLIFAIAVLTFGAKMWGATYRSATCNESDVEAAYKSEQASPADGDIIAIPAGTCTWTTAWILAPKNSITVQGAGAESATARGAGTTGSDQTVIVMGSTDSAHDYEIMNVTTTTAKEFRITGLAFSFPNGNNQSQNGAIYIQGTTQSLRIDHNHFTGYCSKPISVRGWIYGVLDHDVLDNYMYSNNWVFVTNASQWNGCKDDIGDCAWADESSLGTNKFLFIEDTRFVSHDVTTYTNDCGRGGRQVVRYSSMVGPIVTQGHGPKGDDQGCRATEVYMNSGTSPNGVPIGAFVGVLSGPSMVWGNTLTLVKQIYSVSDGRKGDGASQGNMSTSWSMCQNNDPSTLYQGTVNTNGTSVTWVSGGTFVTNWPTISAPNVVIHGVSYAISSVASTTSMTLKTSAGTQSGVTYYVPSKWDGNKETSGYPCIDQPGRGKDDLITGVFLDSTRKDSVTGTVTWPHQVLEPVYVWGNVNKWPGDSGNAIVGIGTASTNIKANRDYYQQMAGWCYGPAYNSCGENPDGITLSEEQTVPFTGAVGIGQGLLSERPATCTAGIDLATGKPAPGVGYWATDQNTLYVCNPANTWTAYYKPYTYPHPLAQSAERPNPPTNLIGRPQ